ncbi:MAG: DNA-directed RNA polymerase subunit beta, partial [Bacilli bacterium]|nr:DNA-directed RNA polymerase subunit beta [Bacilli bacterium]
MGYKNVKYGRNRIRRNYSRVQTNVELPNLIEVQTKSFEWFTTKGLQDLFAEFSPIKDHGGNLELYFDNFEFDEPKYTIPEAKRNDMNYSRPLKADVMLKSNETGEIKQDKIFLGEFPMMTPWGTFVINGAERVVVTQIIR